MAPGSDAVVLTAATVTGPVARELGMAGVGPPAMAAVRPGMEGAVPADSATVDSAAVVRHLR